MDKVTVSFRYYTAHFTLNYPKALEDLPQANLKKLFKYMVSDWHTDANADAIRITHEALKDHVSETKQKWADASVDFQNGFVDTKYHGCRNKKEAAANNKRLLAAVKSSKTAHERAKNLLTFFEDLKAKYN